MRRVKREVVVVGQGAAAMLLCSRFLGLGMTVALVNPAKTFSADDLRPGDGLDLWNAAYRSEGDVTLSHLYDILTERLKELFPAPVDQAGLSKVEHWTILSSTPVHRTTTESAEKEFFRLERKPFSSGQFRLVNPENILTRTKRIDLRLPLVAQVEGAVIRSHALYWNAAKLGFHLNGFINTKANLSGEADLRLDLYIGAEIKGRFGKKIVILDREGEEVAIEAEHRIYIMLTGDLLPKIRMIVASCEEPWLQGVRKRRREQHYVWFEADTGSGEETSWIELGQTHYFSSQNEMSATWQATKGPDNLERVVDEGLRLRSQRFVRNRRSFRLLWDWKVPQWRETEHNTFWATSFEGDLWGTLDLIWNLPRQ